MYFYSVVLALVLALVCVWAQELPSQNNNEELEVTRPAIPAHSGHQLKTRATTENRKNAIRKVRELLKKHLNLKPFNGQKETPNVIKTESIEDREKRGIIAHHQVGHAVPVQHCAPEYVEYEYCYYPQNACY